MRVGIFLFPEVDLLDAGGPYEVFLTASRLNERDGHEPLFDVVTITSDGEPVNAYGGLGLVPSHSMDDVGPLDLVIVPGTIDIASAQANENLLRSISNLVATTAVTASVCTGAFLLASVGLLNDRPWTTHWEDIDVLAGQIGGDGATRGARWVDAGSVVTAGGLASGVDVGLHFVDRFVNRDLANRTARQIDYRWDPDGMTSFTGAQN